MKKFFKDLKKHGTKIINCKKKKKEMTLLTNEEKKYIVSKKCVIYAKKNLMLMMKKKIEDCCLHYYLQMYLKTLKVNVLRYMNLILLIFYLHQDEHSKHIFFKKEKEIELELLTDIDMLLMVEKGITRGI